jgi:hypothetical protein
MNRVRCKSCGDWIVSVITTRGRPLACNAERVRVHLVTEREAIDADREATWRKTRLVLDDGQLVRGYVIPSPRPPSVTVVGRIVHTLTCPKATYFRHRAQTRAAQRAQPGAIDGPR